MPRGGNLPGCGLDQGTSLSCRRKLASKASVNGSERHFWCRKATPHQ